MNEQDIADHLELLDGVLQSDMATEQAMSLSQLDGFLAGIIACPVAVLPAQWINQVWGEKGINVDGAEEARAINGMVIARFKHILFGLYQGFVHPIYDLDDDEQLNWDGWAQGILQAMAMRPEAWDMFGGHDGGLGGEDAHEAVCSLKQLCAYANLPKDQRNDALNITEDITEKMLAMAPDLLPEAILLLYGIKQANGIPTPVSLSDTAVKAGHNDPCPCGSGLTYKECCLPKDREKRLEEAKRAEAEGNTHDHPIRVK